METKEWSKKQNPHSLVNDDPLFTVFNNKKMMYVRWLNGMAAQSSFNSDWELLGGTHQGTSWVGPKSRAFTNFEAICVYIYIYIYIQVGKSLERAKGGGTNPFESAIIIVLLCFHPLLLPSHTPLPLFSPHLFHGEKDIAVTVVTNSSPSFIQLSLLLGQRVFFSLHCEQ